MNKIAIAALAFTAGAAAGFTVGYFIQIEKDEPEAVEKLTTKDIKENLNPATPPAPVETTAPQVDPAELESPKDDDPSELISSGPAHIAKPGKPGVNYAKVRQIVQENGYTDPEDIQAVVNDPDNSETYEERLEREEIERSEAVNEYYEKNKDKIIPITRDEWESDFPEVDFEHEDLYYFRDDDVFTDGDGNVVDEAEFIGPKPRQFGWMANAEDRIYIRNFPKEKDYQVWKQKCTSEEFWG